MIGATANNGQGVAGICWRSKIISIKVMRADGSGYSSDILAGLERINSIHKQYYASRIGIVNLSISIINQILYERDYQRGSGSFSQVMAAANTLGLLYVAAAGNSGAILDRSGVENGVSPNLAVVGAVDASAKLATVPGQGHQDQVVHAGAVEELVERRDDVRALRAVGRAVAREQRHFPAGGFQHLGELLHVTHRVAHGPFFQRLDGIGVDADEQGAALRDRLLGSACRDDAEDEDDGQPNAHGWLLWVSAASQKRLGSASTKRR